MKTACIIGLGLIGGSIAKALRQKAGFERIIAIGRNEKNLRQALDDKTIDYYSTDINAIDKDIDIVFICTPVSKTIDIMNRVRHIVTDKCIITDVGSTKHKIVEAAELANCNNFIGGHPMAGSEKSGYDASNEFLFENAYYLLTPTANCDDAQVACLRELLSAIGAIPIILDSKKHDHIVAAISHLPHIIASCLVNTIASSDDNDQNMHTLAAGGFKDITRIASSDTAMWQSICIENGNEIIDVLDRFKFQLDLFESSISSDDSESIWDLFKSAKDYRNTFASRGSSSYIKEYALYVDILDKPGSIATIATLLSVNNINIKNIGINNNREQQAGVLQVLFETEEEMKMSMELLKNMNYLVFD